jgi:hypothetical protein
VPLDQTIFALKASFFLGYIFEAFLAETMLVNTDHDRSPIIEVKLSLAAGASQDTILI